MGDGLLLEFPSVVAAVECAIAVQKLMVERNADVLEGKRVVYRMGIHLGDLLIEDEDIIGEGVNIAARLEGIAEPGGICISSSGTSAWPRRHGFRRSRAQKRAGPLKVTNALKASRCPQARTTRMPAHVAPHSTIPVKKM
jgi:class 3 adenylate cyclase